MKAVLTRAANADLSEIARHIGRDDISAARRFTAALLRPSAASPACILTLKDRKTWVSAAVSIAII
jgi:hypothetical protein